MVYHEKIVSPSLSHVWFGTILGEDNKAIKTRDGQPVKLMDLLNEAIDRAKQMVKEKNPELDEEEMKRRAKVIGLGCSALCRSVSRQDFRLCFFMG